MLLESRKYQPDSQSPSWQLGLCSGGSCYGSSGHVPLLQINLWRLLSSYGSHCICDNISLRCVVLTFSSRDVQLTQCLISTPRWRKPPWWRRHSRCFCFLHSMHFSALPGFFWILSLTSQSANLPTLRFTVIGLQSLILSRCKIGITRYDRGDPWKQQTTPLTCSTI